MTKLYGIPNCDTIKRAKKWLESNNIDYQFHDYRKDGIDSDWLETAEIHLGWEAMLNKRGTTFRQLPDEQKNTVDRASALKLMLEFPAMIKRPILIFQENYYIGFKADAYAKVFS